MDREIKIMISEDGSHTLFVPELNETYHSHKGALRESLYVFIEKGLEYVAPRLTKVTILEIGFGTGLNALLTLQWAEAKKIAVEYHTLEPYPLPKEIYEKLNYLELLGQKDLGRAFQTMHESQSGKEFTIGEYFSFTKYVTKLEDFSVPILVDLVYYDAFAPSKQPEIWSLENFQKITSLTLKNGVLVSYCASGQFKRNLKAAGFEVETLEGPPGKKEMTRAICQTGK